MLTLPVLFALLAAAELLTPVEALGPHAVTIRAVDAGSVESPFTELEYVVRPGSYVAGSYWTTVEHPDKDTQIYREGPSHEWHAAAADGEISIRHASETVTVFVRSPGYEILPVAWTLGTGSEDTRILLHRVAAVTGVVSGPDGKGVSGASIYLGPLPDMYGTADTSGRSAATTDADGRFEVNSYHRYSPLLLTAYAKSFGPGFALLDADTGSVDCHIRLCAPARVSGNYRLSKGTGTKTTVILHFLTPTRIPYGQVFAEIGEDPEEFSVDALPPGPIQVNIYGAAASGQHLGDSFQYSETLEPTCGDDYLFDTEIDMEQHAFDGEVESGPAIVGLFRRILSYF